MTSIRRTGLVVALSTILSTPGVGHTQGTEPGAEPAPPPIAETETESAPAPTATGSGGGWLVNDGSTHSSRPIRVDPVGTIGFWGIAGFHGGGGVWVVVPVMPDGFLPGINDAFSIEAGALLEYYRWSSAICTQNWVRATPLAGVRWDFFLTEDWTIFAKVKGGWAFGFGKSFICTSAAGESEEPDVSGFAWDAGLGAYYELQEGLSLRIDAGNQGLAAGISLSF